MDDGGQSSGDSSSWIGSIGGIIRSAVDSAISGLFSAVTNIKSSVSNISSTVSGGFSNVSTWLTSLGDKIKSSLSELRNDIQGFFSNLSSWIADFKNNVVAWFQTTLDSFYQWFDNVKVWISSVNDNVTAWFSSLFEKLGNWFTSAIDNIIAFKDGVIEWFANFFVALGDFFISIFVPRETYFGDKNTELLDIFSKHFQYSGLISPFESIKNLTSSTPINITCTLWGNTYTVVDWSYIKSVQPTVYFWVRGFIYPFLLLYNINQLYFLIRGTYVINGSGDRSSNTSSGKG